ncbi:hypothetical protein B0H65DRAFT_461190 [Neurospora tetraspora]|uniref:Transmembrane protein n=1 Tax=Neurospora tetraspora TaxID=94610 RepID=A0AAE0JH08_9PEZI|nr:hypothetical protein B0H65DRAFT_461190 [Neurospora tetraspora]
MPVIIQTMIPSSPAPAPASTSTGDPNEVTVIIWTMAGTIWFIVAVLYFGTQLGRISLGEPDERRQPMVAPRTKFIGRIILAVLTALLWPLRLLWEFMDIIVKEWCIPGWKWCADVCTCDTCCFKNCWDTYEILAREPGDNCDTVGVGSQTAQTEGFMMRDQPQTECVVNNQPTTTGSMEVPPTYQQATKPIELPTYKETTMHTGN